MSFLKKARRAEARFDPKTQIAILRQSVCTGEKTLLFRDRETGRDRQVGGARTEGEWRKLLAEYGLREEDVKKEW